jgi:hypothetical protein
MTTPTFSIEISKDESGWYCIFDNPNVFEIFGTYEIPTPFMSSVPPPTVLREIKKQNPDYNVFLQECFA